MPKIRITVPIIAVLFAIILMPSVCAPAQPAKLQGATEAVQLSPPAARRWEEAVSLAQHCHYDQALRALSDVTEAEPDFAPAYHLRGDIYHRLFHYEDSIAQYSQAISLDPKNSLYLADRGIALMGPDKYVEARKDFDKALSIDKNCSRAIAGQGIDLRDHKKYRAAIAKQKRAMALSPMEWLPHTEWAYCYRQIKRPDEAIKECDKAIVLAPEEAHLNYCKAFAYRDAKQFDKMCQQFDMATARAPEVAEYFYDYARELSQIELNTKALRQINQAIQLEPDNSHYRIWRAAIACDLGQFKEAAEEASAAIALNNDDSAAYRLRARAYLGLKRNTESLADAEKAVKLAPKDIMALNQRSKVLYWISKYKECVESCNEALKIYPKNADQYIYRSYCYFRLDKPALSLADSNHAIKLRSKGDAKNWDFERRAAALVLLHKYDQAEADELKAASIRKAARSEGIAGDRALTAQQSWALACSAMLFIKNHQDSDTLAGLTITPGDRAEQIDRLMHGWGISNAAGLRAEIGRLRLVGDHAQFASLGHLVTGLTVEEYAKYLESIKDQSRLLNRAKIARQYYAGLGDKGILAWDLSRAINICRFAYVAGLIDEKTAWSYILPVCKEIQKHFRNFEEVGQNYRIGRKFWDEDETKENGQDFDVALGELTHFKSSPYRRQAWDVSFDDIGPALAQSAAPETDAGVKVVPDWETPKPRGIADLLRRNNKDVSGQSSIMVRLPASERYTRASELHLPANLLQMIAQNMPGQSSVPHLSAELQLAIQKMMLGLRQDAFNYGSANHYICKIPQNIVAGPRVLRAYPFNSGILLATLPRANGPGSKNIGLMFADIGEMKITAVSVPGLDEISDLVVVAGHAYIAGACHESPVVAELTAVGIKPLPLPPGNGDIHLGIGSGAAMSIRGAEVSQLEGAGWRQLCLTNKPIKLVTRLTPRFFQARVYFVEDDTARDLSWIDVKAPETEHHLADDLLVAYRDSFSWKEIYDWEICNGQLWISLGNAGQTGVLLNIDKDGQYHIAHYRGESFIDPSRFFEVLRKGPLSIAAGEYEDVYFSEGGWIYRIKSNNLEHLATIIIDEKGASAGDWPQTKTLSMSGGTLFVASKNGGALLLKRSDSGYGVHAFSEQTKPLIW